MSKISFEDKSYRYIYIMFNRSEWKFDCDFDVKKDLVLTRDFGLKKIINDLGGECLYLENLVSSKDNEFNNFATINFVENWFTDKNGHDLLQFSGINLGHAFKIHLWSELVSLVRIRASLSTIKRINHENLILIGDSAELSTMLHDLELNFKILESSGKIEKSSYFFDIQNYMDSALMKIPLKTKLLNHSMRLLTSLKVTTSKKKKRLYIQAYHPTLPLIKELLGRSDIEIVTASAIRSVGGVKGLLKQRILPSKELTKDYLDESSNLIREVMDKFDKKLVLASGLDVTQDCMVLILDKLKALLPVAIHCAVDIERFLDKNPINTAVIVTNLGIQQSVLHELLKKRGVKIFLIINGMLASKFGNESKYADYINCYSESMQENYFASVSSALALGDPRMDTYAYVSRRNMISSRDPSIVIGGSGYNNIDLNSYPAIEFEFLYQVLSTILETSPDIVPNSLTIKVRPNADVESYRLFVSEYFTELRVAIVQDISIQELLKTCDLYISISSQTLFEASRLGIPVIYYKIDGENLHEPFNANGPLVTAEYPDELREKILEYGNGAMIFQDFLDLKEMERYIGPLDGYNTERNINFIESLMR